MPDLITADLDEASNGTQTAGFDVNRTLRIATANVVVGEWPLFA